MGPVSGSVDVDGETIGTSVAYCIAHVVEGQVQCLRFAPDPNGPFRCWNVTPGSVYTSTDPSTGGARSSTVAGVAANALELVVSFVIGDDTLTGVGAITFSVAGNTLVWEESLELTGFFVGEQVHLTDFFSGGLERIGNVGTVPPQEGLNGMWMMRYDDGGADGLQIRQSRVIEYIDATGPREVFSSEPTTSSTAPGSFVFIRFNATTAFQSDPVPRRYTITFQGQVQNGGDITGQTSFVAEGKDPVVLDTVLERIASPNC